MDERTKTRPMAKRGWPGKQRRVTGGLVEKSDGQARRRGRPAGRQAERRQWMGEWAAQIAGWQR